MAYSCNPYGYSLLQLQANTCSMGSKPTKARRTTFILLRPPLPLVGVSIAMERERASAKGQNGRRRRRRTKANPHDQSLLKL